MMVRSIYLLLLIFISQIIYTNSNDVERILSWTNKIGEKLWTLGRILTQNTELKMDYSNVNISELNTKELIKDMVTQVQDMLNLKKFALKRIVSTAENCTRNLSDTISPSEKDGVSFRNARENATFSEKDKKDMTQNENFFNRNVSTNFSSVHVPDDVYFKGNETIIGIKWSETLESIFQNNYLIDPTLSWQYFAGASGFMRIFPAVRWPTDDNSADLYDSRMREWYIEAATDPKDVMILIDNSGSMMGLKREIARHTINTILETLSPNDFVNIIHFNNDSRPLVRCFNDSLVQANVLTIRKLKLGVENMMNATNLANFTKALQKAFTVLESHRRDKLASMCNQAIMLITDGVPDSYIEIFKKFNWKNSTESPFPVRVFTYLIGRDGADFRETKWMACANKGFYVQLNTISEVKEQVLNYINVLARPLVLTKLRKFAWTSLYAHEIDSKLTDRYWADEQNNLQRKYTKEYMASWMEFLLPQNQLRRLKQRRRMELDQNKNYGYDKYNFMVTISLPAYDERTTRNITENVLINEAFWIQRVYEVHDAALLGVAGTDIPITEFKKIMNPHTMGVNNYGFIVNNNGYIIAHPDLRPMFRETLKPGYSTVDMLEVELLDSPRSVDSRDFGIQDEEIYSLSNLSLLRDYIINQTDYTNYYPVKFHYDNMRRASTGVRYYSVKKIEETPFTMVLAVMKPPCKGHTTCPGVRILAPKEKPSDAAIAEIFSDNNWTIHPEWFYCKYNYKNEFYNQWADGFSDKKSELIHFLKKMKVDELNFSKNRYKNFMEQSKQTKKGKLSVLSHYCDEELIYNVIYDANITKKYFPRPKKAETAPTDLNISLANVFISTHSGLTRWQDFNNTNGVYHNFRSFGTVYNRSIDEIWYKRAVEQHYFEDESFVFSIPFKDDEEQTGLVTASHAIFVKDRKRPKSEAYEAPVAVVGYQFEQAGLETFIRNIVQNGYENTDYDSSERINYVVLDNNGYIVASSKDGEAGQFFGNIQSLMMKQLKECNVYKQIIIYDYQGVCFQDYHDLHNSAISILVNPFKQVNKFITWTIYTLLWGVVKINLELISSVVWFSFQCTADTPVIRDSPYMSLDEVPVMEERLDSELLETFETFNVTEESPDGPKYVQVRHLVKINRTRPKTCDRKTVLYSLEPLSKWDNKSSGCAEVISSIKLIPHTNLIFVLLKNDFVEKKIDYEYFTTNPLKVKPKYYNYSSVCQKITGILSRRRPSSCCKDHKNESEIKLCGSGNMLKIGIGYMAILLLSILRTILR
ncbi:voltage-dependent calcium channel subunit alpha-2/delta-3-like isoform X3 [Planococcus citri]|uniref:voltage-dependent calcium channel subunit alpha-2/delta-3-like isoform X3 n=1 Tax=Planococcus citri TaxID=170843 RepID=UPI0031F84689